MGRPRPDAAVAGGVTAEPGWLVMCDVGPGMAGDIAAEPRTIDAIAALPAGLSVSGRVGEGEWYGPGPCPGGY